MQRTERNSNRDASAAVKRVWHLWEAVIERGNFVATFHEAARGKRRKLAARACARDLCAPPAEMPTKLEAGTFGTGRFTLRKAHNQKERTIYAPAFVEQVFHHVLMNVGDSDLECHEIHQRNRSARDAQDSAHLHVVIRLVGLARAGRGLCRLEHGTPSVA